MQLAALIALALSPVALQAQILPPPAPSSAGSPSLGTGARLFVRGYRFEGNTAFTEAQLRKVTEPYQNREIGTGEIEQGPGAR